MIVLAGLIGLVGAFRQAYQVATGLAFIAPTSPELFGLKLMLLVAIFVYGFLRFIWAIRQLNYACAMIGAAPWPPVREEVRSRYARQIAQVLTLGMASFNGVLRAYYFALAALVPAFMESWHIAIDDNTRRRARPAHLRESLCRDGGYRDGWSIPGSSSC